METRQSAWIRSAEERQTTNMEVDSPSANLKRLLEARAAKDAKFGKKTKSNNDNTDRANVQEEDTFMEVDSNEDRSREEQRTHESKARKKERT